MKRIITEYILTALYYAAHQIGLALDEHGGRRMVRRWKR